MDPLLNRLAENSAFGFSPALIVVFVYGISAVRVKFIVTKRVRYILRLQHCRDLVFCQASLM